MSGSLAKAYIGANEACKLYTNSSGNPASVTIHAVATDPTSDACLSMKYSSTNATIFATSTVDTPSSVTLNNYASTIIDTDTSYLGYTYHQVACDGPEFATPSLYLDSDGTSTILKPCVLNMVCVNSSYTYENVPTTEGDYNICFSSSGALLYCCYSSIHQNVYNFRNFHNTTIGQTTNAVMMFCCNTACTTPIFVNEGWVRIKAGCFCTYNNRQHVGTAQGDYKYYYTGFDNQCCISDHTAFLCDTGTVNAQDIWHEDNPTFSIGMTGTCVTGCMPIRITAYVSDCNCVASFQQTGCSASSMSVVHPEETIRSMQQYCNCNGCCCKSCINIYRAPHFKPVLAGCGIGIFNNIDITCSQCAGAMLIGYPSGANWQICHCNKWTFWCNMSVAAGGFPCVTCCQQCKFICRFNGSTLKWLTYNPVDNCNYFEIMGDGDTDGIYTLESSCFHLACGSEIAADSTLRCVAKSFEDWVTDGAFVKVSSTPTAWCEKTSYLEVTTQPMQIGDSKWAIWRACATFGQSLSGGWNGCYFRYESTDLINWTKTNDTDNTSSVVCSGTGSSLCKINYTYDGTNIATGTNYYYNTANCVDDSGTLEYKVSANRLERTGIVMSDSDTLYISNDSTTPVAVQVWGYDD